MSSNHDHSEDESDVTVEPDSDSDNEGKRIEDQDETEEEEEKEQEGKETKSDEDDGKKEDNEDDSEENLSSIVSHMAKMTVKERNLQDFCDDMYSEDSIRQFRGTQDIRKMLLADRNGNIPHIQQVIETGIVPQLVNFLLRDNNPELQFEAAWALTNIASGTAEQTRLIIDAGAIINLVPLVLSDDPNVQEQALWTLSNICGDSVEFRDLILSSDIISTLREFTANHWTEKTKKTILQNLSFLISNLCRNKPTPSLLKIGPLLPIAKRLYLNHTFNDSEILINTTWSFAYASNGDVEHLQAILNLELLPNFIQQLLTPVEKVNSIKIVGPVLRILGNLIQSNDDNHTEHVLFYSPFPAFSKILQTYTNNIIRRDVLFIISNIAAGTRSQIQSILDANILPIISNLLKQSDIPIALISESVYIYANIIQGGSVEQIKYVWNESTIQLLLELFDNNLHPNLPASILNIVLEGFVSFFNFYYRRLNIHRQDLIDLIQLLKNLNGENIVRNCPIQLKQNLLDKFYQFLSPSFVLV